MEWAYEFAAGAVFIALLLRSRFVDRFREITMTTPPRFYLGLAVYILGPLTLYTCLASLIYRLNGFDFESGLDRVLYSPLWMALLTVLLFTGLLRFQRFEARVRQVSHRVAGIPDLAQQLRSSIRSASFTMSPQVSDSVQLNLLRRGIALDDIDDARHSILHSQLVTVTALLETLDQWAAEPGSRRFARAVENERIRLRAVVDRIAFRITSTHRGLHSVSAVVARYRSVKDDDAGSLWDSVDASAEQNIYTGESDLMTEVMSSTRFVYNDLIEDLRTVHEEICLLIAQGILRYEYTNQQRQNRINTLGFSRFELPSAPSSLLFYPVLVLLVGAFAVSVVASSTTGILLDPLLKNLNIKSEEHEKAEILLETTLSNDVIVLHQIYDVNATNAINPGLATDIPQEAIDAIVSNQIVVRQSMANDVLDTEKNKEKAEAETKGVSLAMERALRMMSLLTIQLVALGCAIYPKYHYTWANESLTGRPPLFFIAGCGILAGIFSILIGIAFRAVMELSWEPALDFYGKNYPWCLMAVATATCVAWLIQDRRWIKDPSARRQRTKDGACLMAAWVAALSCIQLAGVDFPSPWVYPVFATFAFVLGFTIPSMFRRRRLASHYL